MNPLPSVTIIGAGLAGSEAAWWLAEHGHPVRLFEMRPHVASPAHHSGDFAELVCSNSLKSEALTTCSRAAQGRKCGNWGVYPWRVLLKRLSPQVKHWRWIATSFPHG
jgi:glycine/D-amino acid oxidase-like deaminating enzyme